MGLLTLPRSHMQQYHARRTQGKTRAGRARGTEPAPVIHGRTQATNKKKLKGAAKQRGGKGRDSLDAESQASVSPDMGM